MWKSKLKRHNLWHYAETFLVLLSLTLLLYAVASFYVGGRNIDVVWNFKNYYTNVAADIEANVNEQLYLQNITGHITINPPNLDLGSDLNYRNIDEYYVMGQNYIHQAFWLAVGSAFFLALFIARRLKYG